MPQHVYAWFSPESMKPNFIVQNFEQITAVDALKHFVPAYLQATDGTGLSDITSKYVEQLSDSNVAVRRGSELVLGILPYEFLAKGWKDVLSKLAKSCEIEVIDPFFMPLS